MLAASRKQNMPGGGGENLEKRERVQIAVRPHSF
jgi:hypothetical protein